MSALLRPEDAPLFAHTPEAEQVRRADRLVAFARADGLGLYVRAVAMRAVAEARLGIAVLGHAEVVRRLSRDVEANGPGRRAFDALLQIDTDACRRAWARYLGADPDKDTDFGHGWHVGPLAREAA